MDYSPRRSRAARGIHVNRGKRPFDRSKGVTFSDLCQFLRTKPQTLKKVCRAAGMDLRIPPDGRLFSDEEARMILLAHFQRLGKPFVAERGRTRTSGSRPAPGKSQ